MRIRSLGIAAICCLLASLVALTATASAKRKPAKVPVRTVFGGVTSQGKPVQLVLTADGKKLDHAVIFADATCSDGTSFGYSAILEVRPSIPAFLGHREHVLRGGRLARSGRFTAKGAGALGSIKLSESLSGRVTRAGTASGTYEADLTVRDDSGATVITCAVKGLRWTAQSRKGRTFAGQTSGGEGIVLDLDAGGGMVRTLRFSWFAPCSPDPSYWWIGEAYDDFPISRSSFGNAWQEPITLPDGRKFLFEYSVQGRFAGRRASGTLSVKVTESDAAGTVTSSCDTGPLTWRATSG